MANMKKNTIKLFLSALMIVFMSFSFADVNPYGDGYIQDSNPYADGYVQDKSIFKDNLK